MTVFERLKISAQVALQWERKDYKFMTQAEAWEEGYDAYDNGILFLEPTDTVDCIATADPDEPNEVEIVVGGGVVAIWKLDTATGEIEVYA